jgi:uncharacterized OB-fold protein
MLPAPDLDTEPYWASLADGRFIVQRCRDCGHWTWPARPICSGCHGDNVEWEQPSGTGEVYSWIVTHQPYGPDLPVPYTVALVRLDEQADILVPGRFISEAEIHQGMRVRAVPERKTDDIGILNWDVA